MFLNKIGRHYHFPELIHLTDLAIAIFSYVLIEFFMTKMFQDIDPNKSENYNNLILSYNIQKNEDFQLNYIFASITVGLVFRCALNLQYFEQIGPLIKILGKVLINFVNFTILYCVLLIMFTILGNFNFMRTVPEYDGFITSLVTTVDASMGNYDFEIFAHQDQDSKVKLGQMLTLLSVISFKIVLFNLIISLLSQTYSIFEDMSNGLFLKKILSKRDELIDDKYCGSYLIRLPPFDCFQIFLAPISAALPYGSENLA